MATGKLETLGDHDWFAISLIANDTYVVNVTGLSDFASLDIGTAAELATNEASSLPNESAYATAATTGVTFTPTTTGTYYVDVSDAGSVGKSYTLIAAAVPDDYTNNPTRPGALAVGGSATGTLETLGDHDWFAISLIANDTYVVNVTGLSDFASLDIGTAAELATNEASSLPNESAYATAATTGVTFTPTTTGTYYVDVSDAGSVGKSYTLIAAAVPDDYTNNPTRPGALAVGGSATGTLETLGDHDWFAISLIANDTYVVNVTGLSDFASLDIGTAAELATNEASSLPNESAYATAATTGVTFTPTTTGTYYVDVSDAGSVGKSYTLIAAAVPDDYTNNPTRPGALAVGGSATGTLETLGDHDWFAISLIANDTYVVNVTGLSDFASLDIGTAAELATNEASSLPNESAYATAATTGVTFTPTTTGTYYVDVSDAGSVGKSYTLIAAAVPDDYTNNPTRPGALAVGGSATGTLETLGDHDWFAISLIANDTYVVNVTGLSDFASLDIGTAAELATNEASSLPNESAYATAATTGVTFTPTTTGTYYVDVSDAGSVGKSYTLIAAAVPDDYTNNPTRPGALAVGGKVPTPVAGDFNGDGKSDLLEQNTNGALLIYTMNGLAVTGATSVVNPGSTWHAVGVADFNGDSQPDILLQTDSGTVIDFQMNGTTDAANYVLANLASTWHVRGTGDFNGDGKADILVQNDNGSMVLLETNGTSVIAAPAVGTLPSGWAVEGAADFYGIGQPDILVQSNTGALVVYTMNGASITSGAVVANLGTGWSVGGTGDYNGDGKADILLHNDNGSDVVLTMNGAVATAAIAIGNPGAGYNAAVAGIDLNGDGSSDLVVGSAASSTLVGYTLNNAATITSGTVLGTPGAGWNVVGSNPITFIDGTGATLTLSGTPGPDQFNLTSYAAGIHTISSFDPAQDTVALRAGAFPSYATVQANEAPYQGGTFINLSSTAAIVIHGVTPSQLNASNFVLR